MSSRYLATALALAVTAVVALTPTSSAAAAAADSDWLAEINRYRSAAGLEAVVSEPAWGTGLRHHFTYLARTPASYRTGQYASAHTENPASPYYTADGAAAAGSSNLYEGAYLSPVGFIDGWLRAPFHAIGMLRPALRRVGFASDPVTGSGGLDVIRGLDGTAETTDPVLFPGPGMTTNLTTFEGESPDPTESCSFAAGSAPGLPLIALLPEKPLAGLSATLVGSAGQSFSSSNGSLCVVDEHTYTSSDDVYGPTGRSILEGDKAVLLISRSPLVTSSYTATINQPGRPALSWTFKVDVTPPSVGLAALPSITVGSNADVRFSASDASGVGTFDVRYRRAAHNGYFGGYGYPAAWQSTSSRRVLLGLVRGSTYCFSVRARDGVGNQSTWSTERCTAAPLDDRVLAASSGWVRSTGASYVAGTMSHTFIAGRTLSLSGVHAKRVTIVATTCSGCGSVGVYWNGKLLRTVSLNSTTTKHKQVLLVGGFGSVATGTVSIRSLGSHRVYIDALGTSHA